MTSIEQAGGEELYYRLSAARSLSGGSTKVIMLERTVGSNEDTDENSASDITIFNRLVRDARRVAHQVIDPMIPPNLTMLDSLIAVNFRQQGIHANLYFSEIVDLKTGAVLASSQTTEIGRRNRNVFLYEYDSENRLAYRVHTASLMQTVLSRMSGILITTFLTILLLSYAFWYFIRTVVRQKTLEEMKQDFTNNMTHELKTPISVTYSAIDTLLNFKQGESSEKRKQYLNICIEQLSTLQEFVDKILSMSMERNESIVLKKENISVLQLFTDISEQQKMKTDKCVDTEIVVQPADLKIYADKAHIYNIIGNLIDNAIKYNSDNAKIKITAYQEHTYCVLSIQDNGIGISAENQNYIFDRFYRVPHGDLHKVKGYGLGLFYVKTMVEQHKGKIDVKSEVNKGSEFTIKIPVQ